MKKIDLKCTSCGGMMEISADKTQAVCPYCKNKTIFIEQKTPEESAKHAKELTYARRMGEHKARVVIAARTTFKKIITTIIVLAVLGAIGFFGVKAVYLSLEPMEDPFTCIEVKFSGIDYSGKAEVIDNGTCENFSAIEFFVSKKEELKEGQKIKITAMSTEYRFEVKSKEYTVEGLSTFVHNLDDLTDEMIKKIHEYSYTHLNQTIKSSTFSNYGTIASLKPYKIYLYSNGTNDNTLFDVYQLKTKSKKGKIYTKIVVAYYNDFLKVPNEQLFSYSKLYHFGKSIPGGTNAGANGDYMGFITGFESIKDFEMELTRENDGSYKVTNR